MVLEKDGEDQIRSKEVLKIFKAESNIVYNLEWRKVNCIGHILPSEIIYEGRIEGTRKKK
jgi:hypothetical protein